MRATTAIDCSNGRCRLLRTENQDAQAAYELWHEQFDVDSDAVAPWHQLVREHLSASEDIAARRILEIGCGRGGLACWLAAASAPPLQIVAADYSTIAVRKGQ